MSATETFSITNTTKGKLPKLPFLAIKEACVGKAYTLSLVFIGSTRSRSLNKIHRGKDAPTNILSFELSKNSGEIFIDLPLSKKQSKKFERKEDNFLQFLFIHGLFHLKGMAHGDTMEKAEQKVRSKFKI
ncbi:rRNA maturation RNase YbeY [soil metagenome]